METRWTRCVQLVLLLALVTIPVIIASSTTTPEQHELKLPANDPGKGTQTAVGVESDTRPDFGHLRTAADELIAARESSPAESSSPNHHHQHHTAKKRLAGKESKKYRKKYVSEDDYRKSMPHDAGPQTTSGGGKQASGTAKSSEPHSRKKRLIWVTDDGRLALPPGTSLTIAPTIALPFVRYPPTGFLSNISISLPITIDFDKLGLTDNQNPLGVLPPIFARSMGQAAGSVLADYVSDYMRLQRRKRSIPSPANDHFKITTNRLDDEDGEEMAMPQLPAEHKHAFHGGERALLYVVVEDFIANFGLDGRACMLRAICEVHSKSIEKFGLIGEMLKLFFTASQSPYAEHLEEYVTAEKIGRGQDGPGECFPYYKDCPRSLFRSSNNFQQMYRQPAGDRHEAEDSDRDVDDEAHFGNEIPSERVEYPAREPRATGSRNSNTKESTIVQLEQRDLAEMAM